MEILRYLWDANQVLVHIGDYPLSFLELAGTLTGLASVYYASRASVLTWPTGIINQIFFFLLFYQVQLYSDMLLQLVFFGVSVWGWRNWQSGLHHQVPVSRLSRQARLWHMLVLVLITAGLGAVMTRIHLWLPAIFTLPAAFPYGDAFTTAASVLAIILQARKKLESWWLWIALDVVAIGIYWAKDIRFIAAEYVVFLLMSVWGLWQWQKLYQERAVQQEKVLN
ncbi:nicotinamide riboside transporter PnuC [Cesiribacter sp. SM1]|uniref:nicotinamide riboside transporter PnuC n=1 Tax=Cesiribacter sp. SM1 TaxID=2861196 RepID=UPI001CD3D61D|nr:nicotinamide riboside transporter PnuC [Cesiribacter sp. SM1]